MTVSVNHAATVRLAALAAQAGIERFIYPSSCSVYGATDEIVDELGPLNPVSLYGRVKVASEQEVLRLRTDSFHPTVFRLATVYGLSPRPRFDLVVNTLAGRAAAERRIVVQGGGQWRPFVHVADVASLIAQTLTMPLEAVSGEIFNLGSNSQNYTIAGVAEIVRERVPEVTIDVTEGFDRRNYRVAFDKTASVFGFQPKRTVADGVAEIVRAVENRHVVDIHEERATATCGPSRDRRARPPVAGRPRRRRPVQPIPAARRRVGQHADRQPVARRGSRLLRDGGGITARCQQSKANQHSSLRSRWSSSTSSRIPSGSWARCHRHSRRPASSPSPSGAAARAALTA